MCVRERERERERSILCLKIIFKLEEGNLTWFEMIVICQSIGQQFTSDNLTFEA